MDRALAQYIVPILIMGAVPQAAAGAAAADSVNLGYNGRLRTMPHCEASVYTLEYEHRYTETTSLLGRGNLVNYTSDNGNYREHGILRGLDIGARYYPSGAMRGFFTGASVGYWNGGWTFIQALGRPYQYQGTAHSNSFRLNFDLGYRYAIGDSDVSLIPQASLGKFFSSRSCVYTEPAAMTATPCTQKSEVNAYFFVGLAVGIGF